MRTMARLILFLMMSLPLLTGHELAAESKVKYYKLLKIVHGKTFLKPGKVPADVSADSRGGEVVIKIKMTQRCIERSKFTWGFNKDIDILKPGDSFDVKGHAWTMPDDCYKKRTPYFLISGSRGHLMARSIFNRLGSSERKGASRGKRLVTGSTPRIYASRGEKTKAATISVRKDAAASHIWFLLHVVATSPIVSSNESIDYRIVYFYEAVYGSHTEKISNWTGTWDNNFKRMVLTQRGSRVTGNYAHDNGKIVGTVSGNTLRGTWSEGPSYHPPEDAGDFEFTLSSDGMSFSGKWRYGSSGNWKSNWNGKRR